jgi:threonylcarbamoyladenosine tRNA methylthiotransferase MtaB
MRRRYKSELYASRVAKIKSLMPDACIGVDVITGFPGEGEEEFLETYHFLNELDISYLHVFTYSERKNTKAVGMKGIVPKAERKRRTEQLFILSDKKKNHFYENQQGKMGEVLWENEVKDGKFLEGFTQNYLRVRGEYRPERPNTLEQIALQTRDEDGLFRVV